MYHALAVAHALLLLILHHAVTCTVSMILFACVLFIGTLYYLVKSFKQIDYEMNSFVDYTNVDYRYTLSYQHRACYSANADARTCFRGKSQRDIRV